MTRKSHSWSPASTRGKSADPFGPSTPSQPGDQLVLCTRPSRGERENAPPQPEASSPSPLRGERAGVRGPFTILPIPFAIIAHSVRACSRTFMNVRDNSRYFHPPSPPSARNCSSTVQDVSGHLDHCVTWSFLSHSGFVISHSRRRFGLVEPAPRLWFLWS